MATRRDHEIGRAEAHERGLVESDEHEMIHSVFELGDTLVRELMVPRTDMVWIEKDKTLRQALSLALRSGLSRVPVVGESIDQIIGIAYVKDLAKRTLDHHEAETTEKVEKFADSGAVSKSADTVADDDSEDELEKSAKVDSFWGGRFVPLPVVQALGYNS